MTRITQNFLKCQMTKSPTEDHLNNHLKATRGGGSIMDFSALFNKAVLLSYAFTSLEGAWLPMANITHLYGKNRSGGSVILLDPWMSP